MSESPDIAPLAAVPLFPLPNVVLLPHAILPLHTFEERYKEMTADALAGDRLVAMALLKPGWEKDYHARPAIEPIVCVGHIASWEQLDDGCYNFLLQGRIRARILREHADTGLPYRVAELAPVPETPTLEIDLADQRQRLVEIFQTSRLAAHPSAPQFRTLLRGNLTTEQIADISAFTLIDDLPLKQALLGEGDVRQRVVTVVNSLEESARHFNPAMYGLPADPGVN